MATREAEERTLKLRDGVELFYRCWRPTSPSENAIILFHRGHEHSGRWQDFVDQITLDDHWFFAWDARGHGRSPGDRGYAESFGQFVKDADEFVQHVTSENRIPLNNVSVIGQSVGAVIAVTWVHDFAPPIRALIVATPAFRIKLYVPFAISGLRLLHKFRPKSFIKSYVKPRLLTHDPDQVRAYAADELISPQIAVNILLGLHDTSSRIVADSGAITAPTLLLISGSDWVVKIAPQWKFFSGIANSERRVEVYPGFFHSTFWEKQRERPIAAARQFVEQQRATSQSPLSPLEADQVGYTKEVYTRLQLPLSKLSLRWWSFFAQKVLLRTFGRLSRGIRVGWKRGFDSGESLDHVYRDTAEGTTPIGRWIDRLYLNSPGWKGIRIRKVHLQKLLDRAISELASRGEPIRLLDIAAGPGRYVLDTIKSHPELDISATLCDRDLSGLSAGRQLAASMGIETVNYRENDAFDGDAIAAITPQPNVAIVSGLYELFPSNEPVRNSLSGIGQAVPQHGYLIYTNQPWHPQQEMIARVLPNRDGEPWVMRCRTQAEMDQLVSSVGFRKVDMLIDEAGIFSVSLAVKT